MKNLILFLCITLQTFNCLCFSQDIHFSQFPMTPLLLNPAQTGAQNDMRAVLNYKNQWSSVAEAFKTYNLSCDLRLGKKKSKKGFSALGVNIFNDRAGDTKMGTIQGNLAYAYQCYLTEKNTLGAGLYVGFGQRGISSSNLKWGNQYDGNSYNASLSSGESAISNNLNYIDLGAGIHWQYQKEERYITGNDQRKFNAGIAVFHIIQPKYSFYNTAETLSLKEVAYANALIGLSNSHFSIVPGIAFFLQGKSNELIMGSMFRYQLKESSKYTTNVKGSAFSIGAHYRNKDAVIASILYEFSQYAIGISYDVNVSGIKSASKGNGGFEISLRFVNPNPFFSKNSKSRI